MCNPLWGQIFAPCTLNVDAQVEGNAAVTAVVAIDRSGTETRETRGLPVSISLDSGMSCRVTVTAMSPGDDSTVRVTSLVTGADPRGPDVCIMRVNENHPLAHETILASTR